VFWLRLWRATWFLFGCYIAVGSLMAEAKMSDVFNGKPRPFRVLIDEADSAMRWFPFDPHLRLGWRNVHHNLDQFK